MNRNPGIRLVSVGLDGTLIRSDRTSAPEGVRLRVVSSTLSHRQCARAVRGLGFHRPRDLYQRRADSGLAARAIRHYILLRRPGWWRLTHSIVY